MQPGDNIINHPLNQTQPVKYAAVIASPGYPDVPERRYDAFLYKMPAEANITLDIVIPKHQGFSDSQKVLVIGGESKNIDFDGTVSSRFSIKQTGSSYIQILTAFDRTTFKYPVFILQFAGK